jgi:Zn finger protein HypA/HybF involved in hydrogenase expression
MTRSDVIAGFDQSQALDGSVAAGALSEVFGIDMSAVVIGCESCHDESALAEKRAYVDGPGVTVRCPACASVLVRVVRTPTDLWFSLQGSATWRVPVGDRTEGPT